MTRFRYEAILHIGPDSAPVFEGEFLDWADRKTTVDEICSVLSQHAGRLIGIKDIQNARIERDLAAMAILDAADGVASVGELRPRIEQTAVGGIHPQELFDLENEDLGFAVFLSSAACRNDGTFDACFHPQTKLARINIPRDQLAGPDASAFSTTQMRRAK